MFNKNKSWNNLEKENWYFQQMKWHLRWSNSLKKKQQISSLKIFLLNINDCSIHSCDYQQLKCLLFFFSSMTISDDPYIDSHGSPPWLPTTFILTYELPQFAAYFQVSWNLFDSMKWILSFLELVSRRSTDW